MKLCQVHREVPEQRILTCNDDIQSQNVHGRADNKSSIKYIYMSVLKADHCNTGKVMQQPPAWSEQGLMRR